MSRRLLHDEQLTLMRTEHRLVTAMYEHPGALDRPTEHALRYALSLAQLGTFQPGAAAVGKRVSRPDVSVRHPELERFRQLVLDHLAPQVLHTRDAERRLLGAASSLGRVRRAIVETRARVLEVHANDFSSEELDRELGQKTLVSVAGGGGGAGYVYIGAWEVLQNAGHVPAYVLGSSIGAVLGLFRARSRAGDFEEYMSFAKTVRFDDVLRVVSFRARYGLPGVLRLFLHAGIGSQFQHPDGRDLRLDDLEIPFESVVAGVRRGALGESPDQYARSHHLPEDRRPSALALRAQLASQLVKMVGFFNPMMVREIVIGGDALTRQFDCVDAAGFSAAIPGILHYDVARSDRHMHEVLDALLDREDVVALVDGGVANNVPANTAFRRVQEGVIGTRNCYYLCFDSLHPQTTLGHVWLQPVERVVALQVALNERYMSHHIKFSPTLSPVHLLPNPRELDRAVTWGRAQMARELPLMQKFFERVELRP
ncbi:MAG: patatin-like phospholipase family protein [Polyangiaceae bacterium]|nr:patatin-like phospholipase family protein [Polyangiaceae bacterium]